MYNYSDQVLHSLAITKTVTYALIIVVVTSSLSSFDQGVLTTVLTLGKTDGVRTEIAFSDAFVVTLGTLSVNFGET